MKPTLIGTTALLALASALLPATQALAARPYADGDIFLGFRISGQPNDYFVDIGQPDAFETATAGATVTIGNFDADLKTAFGNSYYSSSLLFSLTGGNEFGGTSQKDDTGTIYTTAPGTLYAAKKENTQDTAISSLQTLATNYGPAPSGGAVNPKGVIEATTANNSYRSFEFNGANSPNSSYNYFTTANETAVTNDGTTAAPVHFEQISPSDGGANGYNQSGQRLLGNVAVSPAGVVTFTAVPEPTSILMLGLGATAMLTTTRRRRAVQS